MVGLTQHSPRRGGRHAPPRPPATTPLTPLSNVSQGAGGRANNAVPPGPPRTLSKGREGKRGSLTGAPEPSYEPATETSTSLKDSGAGLVAERVTHTSSERAQESVTEVLAKRKSSLDSPPERGREQEREKGRRGSGEDVK